MLLIPVGIFAEEQEQLPDKSEIVRAVLEHLSMYSRYEEVSQSNLYKKALLSIIDEHPELYEEIMKIALESVDEHSEYYNPEEAQSFREDISGTIVGIGVTFEMGENGANVMSVIPDTPAEKAGIHVGDVIVSADGTEFKGMNSDTVANHIRGEEGTSVKIGIKRDGEPNIIYLDMIRETIMGTSVKSDYMEQDGKKLMYIKVYGFVTNTAELFKKALDEAKSKKVKNIIIDLRDNGGGLLNQAITMADYLLPTGSKITTEDHKITGLNHTYKAEFNDDYKFNTVILINENSASASEVLTEALRENDSAYIIGTKSYGKGTIQSIIDLPFDDCMKYTVAYYLTPKGNNINKVGITPDLEIKNSEEPMDMSKYPQFGYTKIYENGDRGEEVKTAKELLAIWGSYRGEINDIFDDETERAVYSFQAQTGLYPYGVLDCTTQHQLYNRIKASKIIHDDQMTEALKYFDMEK